MLRAYQIPLFHHLPEVLGAVIDGRPYRYHQFDAHLLQFLTHGGHIRPVFWVELIFSLLRPVEEIGHDHIQRQTELLILPGHGKQLLLGLIAQLALPEAKAVFRHHGRPARKGHVSLLDLRRRIPCDHQIVDLSGTLCVPFRTVHAKGHPAHRRIVPQKTVTDAGHIEGNADLGIALCQLQHTALHVQIFLLVLAHTEDLLFIPAVKSYRGGEAVSRRHFVLPSRNIKRHAGLIAQTPPILLQKQPVLLIIKR